MHSDYDSQFSNRLSYAFTAAALSQVGDQEPAKSLWQKALSTEQVASKDYLDYGSDLRDQLIALTLFLENKQDPTIGLNFAEHISSQLSANTDLSTQDQGWLILATHALFGLQKDLHISLNNQAMQTPSKGQAIINNWQGPNWDALRKGLVLKNNGNAPIRYSIDTMVCRINHYQKRVRVLLWFGISSLEMENLWI